ncbi:hypothetical protein Q1695_007567 [Nippostrongylus brasiliensis]|nr:hypothetical protein Q1695_007567 [Nippostrongylus brasiliensis]
MRPVRIHICVSISLTILMLLIILSSWNRYTQPFIFNGNTFLLAPYLKATKNELRYGYEDVVVPRHYPVASWYLVSQEYNLATCRIPKNLATIRNAIFCYLNDADEYERNRTMSTEYWDNKGCYERISYTSLDDVKSLGDGDMRTFVVLRHPIDRFLSGFTDRCYNAPIKEHNPPPEEVCLGCKQNLTCFLDRLHSELVNFNESANRSDADKACLRHFFPQTWFCEVTKHKRDYDFIRLPIGTDRSIQIAKEFSELFRRAGIPADKRARINSEILKGKTRHTTFGSTLRVNVERQLLNDVHLLSTLIRIYYYDFVELGYS